MSTLSSLVLASSSTLTLDFIKGLYTGSGPKKEAYTPGMALSPWTRASFSREARKPPWLFSTRVMTQHLDSATMPEFFGKRFDSKALKLAASLKITG